MCSHAPYTFLQDEVTLARTCKPRTSSNFQSARATITIPMTHIVQETTLNATKPKIQGTKKSHAPSTILIHSVNSAPGLASAQRETATSRTPTIHAFHALGAANHVVFPSLH